MGLKYENEFIFELFESLRRWGRRTAENIMYHENKNQKLQLSFTFGSNYRPGLVGYQAAFHCVESSSLLIVII